MTTTLAAVRTFQQCERKHDFMHIQRLEPRMARAESFTPRFIRAYLDAYYSKLQQRQNLDYDRNVSEDANIAHHAAKGLVFHGVEAESTPLLNEFNLTVAAAHLADDDDGEMALMSAYDTALGVCEHYYQIRGVDDARRLQIIMVAEPLNDDDRIDLLTVDAASGKRVLFSHRIVKDTPPKDGSVPLSDLRVFGLTTMSDFDDVCINYIWPDLPHIPKMNKDRSIARSPIATTWATYAASVLSNGGNLEDYADMQRKLEGRETSHYFPRVVIVPNAETIDTLKLQYRMLRTNITLATGDIRHRRERDQDVFIPYHLGHYCETCPYRGLCVEELATGTITPESLSEFVVRDRKTPAGAD